ncbi:MAG: hypothetical protein CMQ70_02520 [Gammaproteobacteria bacterium]|nr:hypothetical protein [Gammaproteobacteria bacterium]MDC3098594.1 glucokinase [Gammaproteobacteria bacterium]
MSTETLLIDLGGTNLRAGAGDTSSMTISDIQKIKVDTNKDIFDAINEINSKNNYEEIVISAAGPVSENKISMTNRELEISATDLEKELNVKECHLLNDWESIGYSLPLMTKNDFNVIKSGNMDNSQTCLAIGPGTGLGFSVLRHVRNVPYVYPTELGNARSYNDHLSNLFKISNSKNFIVLENYLSGTGIKKIYAEKSGKNLTTEEIVSLYLEDDLATFILNNFVVALNNILQDLALTFNARGGIFFAGSLMRTISEMNSINYIKEEFNKHSSEAHSNILKNISINLINKEHTPLYGNLNYSVIRRLHE